MAKTGRPSKFNQGYIKMLNQMDLATNFAFPTVKKACAFLGISRDTYYRWIKQYPEFREAHGHLLFCQHDNSINSVLTNELTNEMKGLYFLNPKRRINLDKYFEWPDCDYI